MLDSVEHLCLLWPLLLLCLRNGLLGDEGAGEWVICRWYQWSLGVGVKKQVAIEAQIHELDERQKGLTTSLRAYIDDEGTALGFDFEVSELFLAQVNPGIDEDDAWRDLNLRLGCVIEDVERSQT